MWLPAPEVADLLGNLLRFHARGPETGGAYCLIEALTAPGAGAPPNRHPGDDEGFYVLEGTFEFVIADATFTVPPGSFVKIPNGAVHAFKNVGPEAGRLIINSPGKAHEAFFTEAGEPMPPGTRDLPPPSALRTLRAFWKIGRRNGLEFLVHAEAH